MQRAVNPATGETVFLVDNQWVAPTQVAKNDAGQSAFLINNQWVIPPPVVDSKPSILAGTTLPADAPPMGNRMISEVGTPNLSEVPKFDVSKMPTEAERAAATFGLTPEMGMGEKALRTVKAAGYGASTALQQTWLGGARMIADMTGLHQDDVKGVSKQLAKEQGAVEKTFEDNYGLKIAKNIGESVLANVPTIYTGLAAGLPAAYTTMFGQSFLQTYDDSRNEGLNVAQSTARSALFGAAEVLGERIGLPTLFKGIKDIGAGVSAKELAKTAANFVMKDLAGEELTYLSQYLTDLGFGLNPQASLEQFFQGAVDTALVTVGQGAVMGGAGMASNKILKEIRNYNPDFLKKDQTVLQQGKNVTVEGAPPTPPAPPAGTPPAGPQDLSKFKALEDQDIEEQDKEKIDRLDALEAEFKTIDEKYKTATPAEFGDLNRRQGEITKEMNDLVAGATTPPAEAAAPKAPTEERKEKSSIQSSASYNVTTEDSGTFPVQIMRMKDGSVDILDDQGHVIKTNKDFAKGKSDADLLAYHYEPLGYQSNEEVKKEAAPKAPEATQREAEMQMDVDKYGKPKLEEALNNNDRIFIDTTDVAGKKTYYAKGVGSIDNKYAVPLELTPKEKKSARLAEGDLDLAETTEERDAAKKQLEDVLRPAAERAISKTPPVAKTATTVAPPKTPEEIKPPRKIIPQEFTPEEIAFVGQVVGSGNGLQYNDEVKPVLKKFEKAGLLNIKNNKVYVSQEAEAAGIRGGDYFVRFTDSPDMDRVRAFLGYNLPAPKPTIAETKPAEPVNKEAAGLIKNRIEKNIPINIVSSKDGNDWYASGQRIKDQRYLVKLDLTPVELKKAQEIEKEILEYGNISGVTVQEKENVKNKLSAHLTPAAKRAIGLAEEEKPKTKAEINKERQAKQKEAAKEAPKPKEPKKGTSMYAAKLLADAQKSGDITGAQAKSLMYREMTSNTKDYIAAIEKAIADTKAAKEKPTKTEVHIEGKKEEPVTSKTIEESMEKAVSKVDYAKIKAAVKNQFDQAIKRATVQTKKDWDRTSADSYVTINIPGDGTFKVKNNVERLKELQSKITNAVTPKAAPTYGGPSSGAKEAFKSMVEENDMENAMEYAKLQKLDIKDVKLSMIQKRRVERYLKNPAEFEREMETKEEKPSDRELSAARERLDRELAREEEARFSALVQTTIRSTESQLKGDIAKRKITSMDAERMLSVFPNYPEGVVKPYTVKQLQKLVGPTEKNFVVDDEGDKLTFPLFVDMAAKGYKVLGFDNPRTYENKGGTKYRTVEKDGVRLAFGTNEVLFYNPKYPDRSPQIGNGNDNQIVWHFLGVDPTQRNKGKATKAVADLMEVADKNSYTLFGEPAQLEEKGMTAEQLSKFYSKFGFGPRKDSKKIIVREPGGKSVEDEDAGNPGSFVDNVVKDFAEKAQQDFLVGDDVRVGNSPGTVVGLEGDYIKFRPISATNPKAYQRVQKKNVEFVSRPSEGINSSASKSAESKFGTEAGQLNADMAGLVQLLGANMYASNLVDVTVKELLQNSFDAVKGAVSSLKEPSLYKSGHITIEINDKTRTIKITDDARGMSTDIVKNALFTVAGSDKSDLAPEDRSGGLGLAKMGFMMGAERLKVDTVRDGVRTVVDTSGENIARSNFEIKKTPAPKKEHGTTIEVTIPTHYTDPRTGDKKDIWFTSHAAGLEALKNPLIGPVEIKLIDDSYGAKTEKILASGINFDEEATPFKTKANFDWGSADIYFGVQRKDYPKHQVLSSGVYQFNGPNKYASHFMLNDQEKIPYDVIVNIKPKVDAKHPDYPFENSRESFKSRLNADIESLEGFLRRVARGEEAKDLKESFEGIVSMPRVEVGQDVAEVSKKLKKVFDQRGGAKETKAPEMPREIVIRDNVVSDTQGRVIYDKAKEEEKKKVSTFKAEEEAPTGNEFMIEMTQDPKLPIFHNNTNVNYIEVGRQYGDPEKFFAELGTLMVEMKEEMAKSGLSKYNILSPENLFFAGISIDKGYGGVFIKLPYKGMFLNPFYGWGAKSLFGVRQNYLNTMIHEIAHTGEMSHGVAHNNQMIRVEQYLADQGLLDYYRDAILDILSRHESTFTAMKEAYEKSTTANIAKSLEDIGGTKSARGDEGGGADEVPKLPARTGQRRNESVRSNLEEDGEGEEYEGSAREQYLAQREADGREDFKLKTSKSVKDMLLGSYGAARAAAKAVKESPMLAVNKMTSKLDRAITYARIKGVWYGRGLEVAEVKKFNGKVRDGQEKAIATVALTNALHSGEIMSQAIMRGKLVFDTKSQMFRAEDAKESLANVMLAKHDLIERVGGQEANNMIQDYFEAKRSRSILNAFQKQEGIVEKAKEKAEKIEFGTDAYYDALDEVEKAKNDFYNIAVARSKVKLSDESIDIYSALEDDNPELKNMMENWQAVNSNNLDNMEFSGLISKKRAKSLREIEDYVPWQRVQDEMDDVHSAPVRGSTKSLTNVAKEKVFKRNAAVNKAARDYIDGEIDLDEFNEAIQKYQENLGEIDDILDNMLHNTAVLGRNSMRNHAANMIASRYAERYTEGKKKDKLKLYREEGRDDNGVRLNIVVNGKRVIVNIPDPLIAEAVVGMENINMPAVEIFAVMANLLRRGITTWPQFQLRQLFMDAPTAAMVSGLGAKNSAILYADTFKSFLNALNSEDPIVRHLKAYGIGGFQSYTRSPEQQYKQQIGLIEQNKLDQFTNILDKIGDASDMAQRIATYKRVLAETGDETLALIRSNNIIDFKKHGNAKMVVAITRSVSFMNAYAQQLDVLAEALAGGGLKGKNRGAAFGSMLKVAAMLTMWTTIYTMIMGGDDDYEKMDDQKKARNFVIPKSLTKHIGVDDNILLPMNTSAAYFFKAMPELITNYVIKKGTKDEVDGTRLRKALAEAAIDSLLGPNPIATGIKPAVEIKLKHNFFTGGPITPKGLEGLDAAEQYNASTSELGKILSAVVGGALNPIEMDHLVRGIFGTNGAVVMWGSNMLSGERPTAEQKDNPLWGGLMDRDVGRGPETLFYDLKSEVEPKHKTFMKLIEREKDAEADKYFNKHKKEIAAYEYVTGIESALKEINKEIRRVGEVRDPKFSKDDRRKEIQELQKTKNDILEDVIQIRKEAGL
jgi:hypothetical protein